MNSFSSLLNFFTSMRFISLGILCSLFIANCIYSINGLSLAGDRGSRKLFGGYKITPKFCNASRTSNEPRGPTICMFNHECTQRQGQVVGACMDGFLFGTCCQLPLSIESPLLQSETKTPSGTKDQTVRPQIINNQYYGGNSAEENLSADDSYINNNFNVPNNAVMISSPTSQSHLHDNDQISSEDSSNYHLPPSQSQSYSPELPSVMQTGPMDESSSISLENDATFDHSDISHEPADSNIVSENKISSIEMSLSEASTEKIKYSKPVFKLKTTTAPPSTDKYVLVHTISNSDEIQEEFTRKPTTADSIQSIILMLNDTNPGPEYEVTAGGGNYYTPESTPGYSNFQSTASMENNFVSSSGSFSRPTTLNVPSTSYVYSPHPITRRPTRPVTKTPEKLTTLDVPHTSYVYSPNPSRRPLVTTSTVQPNKKFTTIPSKKTTIIMASTEKTPAVHNQPQYDELPIDNNYVVISGGGITKHPSPTVHITPKPIVNVNNKVTQSIQTKLPLTITTYTTTQKPIYSSTNNYGPHIQDFQDEGYFGVGSTQSSIRPGIEHTVTSTTYFTAANSNGVHPSSSTLRPQVPPGVPQIFVNKIPSSGEQSPPLKDETATAVDDLNNFPPVRHPNLNMTMTMGGTPDIDPEDIATPAFVEDEALDEKMNLLVKKIVASLQGNFDNLVDIVYERKNISTAEHDISNLNKDETKLSTTTKKPTVTKATKPTKAPTKATQKPVKASTVKPPAKPVKASTVKPPSNAGRPTSAATTKKPAKASTTTKKPATRRTTPKPAADQTTKKPVKVQTTTKKPTSKPTRRTTTTTTTTERAPQLDEEVDEVEEDEESADTEEAEDEIVEESEADEVPEEPIESGRIQCGVRPQLKSGRIVGGKASAFGSFPWQVLVRESTWLGLFTKNKCGGVLISNSYVITAAHCQPGFLASLVAVFGEHDISGELEPKRSVTKNVKRVIVHRQYDPATFENDLAILELESPVHYDAHIVPICMPPDNADFTGRVATVSGWGRLKYGGGVPSVLQEVQVPIIENRVCQDMFLEAGHSKKILSSFLCAGYATGQKDSCEGDSGGPLVIQRPDGRYQLVGTVSHGIKCASPFLPGVYMRTTYYKPWLKSITGVK